MSETINREDLVSTQEVARRLGVVPSAVSNWRKRDENFPRQIGGGERGGLYLWSEIEQWNANRERGYAVVPIGARLAPYRVTREVAI